MFENTESEIFVRLVKEIPGVPYKVGNYVPVRREQNSTGKYLWAQVFPIPSSSVEPVEFKNDFTKERLETIIAAYELIKNRWMDGIPDDVTMDVAGIEIEDSRVSADIVTTTTGGGPQIKKVHVPYRWFFIIENIAMNGGLFPCDTAALR